jgi:transcriptional regulator with XRE-family HTH domain
MNEFRPAKRRVKVSVAESVRILRELQGLSQNQLSELTGIPQTTLSAIENDRVRLGVERGKVLARALKCHPAVLVFPWMGCGTAISSVTLRNVQMRPSARRTVKLWPTAAMTRPPRRVGVTPS